MARKNKADAAAPEAVIEQVEKPGMGIDEGIILATFFLLIGAISARRTRRLSQSSPSFSREGWRLSTAWRSINASTL